jgi:uncharacterized membrane protein YkvA (DUF1232 family)
VDAKETEQRFIQTLTSWLVSLPFDLKVLFDCADNEDLDRSIREMAVGALIYAISPNDFIADRYDSFVSYCDDVIIVRMVMQRSLPDDDEDAAYFKSRFPEFFDTLTDDLAMCESHMGELYSWLSDKVAGLHKLEYKGKAVAAFLDEDEAGELLYEDGLGFRSEYPVEEETLVDKFKKSSTILDVIRRRMAEEARAS